MLSDVWDYVSACISCNLHKNKPLKSWTWSHEKLSRIPFRVIVIDHIGPFPKTARNNRYILRVVCPLTMVGFLIAVSDTKTGTTILALECFVFASHGYPSVIRGDNAFGALSEYAATKGIRVICSSADTPSSQWAVERPNKEHTIKVYQWCRDNMANWDLSLPALQLLWRLTPYERLCGRCPLESLCGCKPRLPIPTTVVPGKRVELPDAAVDGSCGSYGEWSTSVLQTVRDEGREAAEEINRKNVEIRARQHGVVESPLAIGDIVCRYEKLTKSALGREDFDVFRVTEIVGPRTAQIRKMKYPQKSDGNLKIIWGPACNVNTDNYVKLGTKSVVTPMKPRPHKGGGTILGFNNYTSKYVVCKGEKFLEKSIS